MLNVSACSGSSKPKIDPRGCPHWLKDASKYYTAHDIENGSDSLIFFLDDYQQEYQERCE